MKGVELYDDVLVRSFVDVRGGEPVEEGGGECCMLSRCSPDVISDGEGDFGLDDTEGAE